MSVKWKLYVFLMLNKHNMHRTFAFWSMRLSRKYASIRACEKNSVKDENQGLL